MEPQPPSTPSSNKKAVAAFVLVLAVVIIAVGATVFAKKNDSGGTSGSSGSAANASTSTANSPPASSQSADGGAGNASGTGSYKDGTYSATGSYSTPESQETIGVTLTIKGGVVADSSLDQHANARETEEYQARFAGGYKQLVVGKKLSEIKLSHVSGSSLTSQGFNSAVQDIQNQARRS